MDIKMILYTATLIEHEAEEHRAEFLKWRHEKMRSCGRLLPQDLGYLADERQHCVHCMEVCDAL